MEIDNIKLFKHFTLLYVEDDDVVRKELFEILDNFFFKVFVAKDGKEGLDLYKKEKIDIILSDINMPELNGIEMLNEIRKVDEEIPTVFCTAYSDNDFLLKSIKLNVHDYLIKPIDIRKLLIVMKKVLKNLYQDILLEQRYRTVISYIVLHFTHCK